MNNNSVQSPVLYFGKLPCRGDFVRGVALPALVQSLDRWLSSGVELMADDAHWKQMYDQAPGARFAMLGMQRKTSVVGYLMPSSDASGRRFPFVVASTLEAESGLSNLSPLVLESVWAHLASLCHNVHSASVNADTALAELNTAQCPPISSMVDARSEYLRFLEETTLSQLTQAFGELDASLDIRRTLLALGLLLQPLLSSGLQPVDKGLSLPLPASGRTRWLVATFWMDLISSFALRTPHDLTLFMPDTTRLPTRLLVGFSTGSATVLHGLLDARATDGAFVSLDSMEWVEEYVANDYGLKKLSSYLQLPQMSLAQVSNSFQEVFLGS